MREERTCEMGVVKVSSIASKHEGKGTKRARSF